jgi:hypothetical protein
VNIRMDWSLNRASLGAIAGSVGLCCALLGSSAASWSAEPAATAQTTGKRFATVSRIRGEVAASSAGKERKLREGDLVYVGERVRATALGEAVLQTDDAGMVAIRPSTEFVAERFAADDKPTDGLTVRLLTGSLRVISGWIARTNRSGHSIVTPSATIGIRGTDHEPYVLSAELAASTANKEGTYDKVNRGGTTMEVGENKLDIDAGRVGFVRAPAKPAKENKSGFRERAMLTLLMPVLLDKVPNFYVPGEFDADLDRYSQTADQVSQRQLEQRRKAPPPAAAPTSPVAPTSAAPAVAPSIAPAAPAAAPATTPAATSGVTPVGDCAPTTIAKTWLEQLDGAIVRRDAATIVAMFAPEVAVRATVRGNEGKMTAVDISREELAQSTLAAMKGLKDYKQRRVWTEGKAADAGCHRIAVKSVAIEQGRQSGKPYRFEALEEYLLELRAGKWLAIKAETTQQ